MITGSIIRHIHLSGNMIFCHAPGTCAVLMFIFVSHTADLCIIRTFNTQIQIMALSAPVINSSMFCNIHIITLLSICTVANPLMALTFLTDTNTLYLKKFPDRSDFAIVIACFPPRIYFSGRLYVPSSFRKYASADTRSPVCDETADASHAVFLLA